MAEVMAEALTGKARQMVFCVISGSEMYGKPVQILSTSCCFSNVLSLIFPELIWVLDHGDYAANQRDSILRTPY